MLCMLLEHDEVFLFPKSRVVVIIIYSIVISCRFVSYSIRLSKRA